MLATGCRKCFERALYDSLASNVDPAPGSHLAVHCQFEVFQSSKLVAGRPMRHEVGIGNQHARCMRKSSKNCDGLARLNDQGFVVFQTLERADNVMKCFPASRCATRATIDDQIAWVFGNFFIEVIHQCAKRCFLMPAFARNIRSARSAHRSVSQGFSRHSFSSKALYHTEEDEKNLDA